MAEHNLELPGWDDLTLLVESALASRDLYYVSEIEKPTSAKLAQHFEAFVLACVLPSRDGNQQ